MKNDLGTVRIIHLNRPMLIANGKKRARQGAGPVTLAIDFSYLRTLLTHAAAIHGIIVDTKCFRLARTALTHLGLIGRSTERERRPTEAEISDIIAHFENTPSIIPMARIVKFAIATAMRQEEIRKYKLNLTV